MDQLKPEFELKPGQKKVELPSGKIAIVSEFKGKHIREAQKHIGDDSDRMMFSIIAMLVTIEGESIVMEDLDEMPGSDVLKLMGEFSQANF